MRNLPRLRLALVATATLAPLVLTACDDGGRPSEVSAPVDTAGSGVRLQFVGAGDAALVVPVHINGQGPFQLILDTGATLTCVDTALARQLDLPERRAVGAAVGVGGAGSVSIVGIDSIRVGQASAHGLLACTMDLRTLQMIGPDLHGLLGLNFLRSFRTTLDFEHDVLYLTRSVD